jgi:hypothetical protein
MLSTLFGDLGADKPRPQADAPDGFAPTAVLESAVDPQAFNIHGQIDDPHAQNLFVTGSPAQAIREHFRRTRADLGEATQMITVLDLARHQGPQLVKALSETTGTPLERLHLRDQPTLRSIALIERATVQRREHDTIKVYHADARGSAAEDAEVCAALMERSQMSVVLLEGAPLDAILDTLQRLQQATKMTTWRCPMLAFVLPEGGAPLASRIRSLPWPQRLRVDVVPGPLRGSSVLWNTLLMLWERRHHEPTPSGRPVPSHDAPDAELAQRLLGQLLLCEGVQACALVDGAAGQLLAGESALPVGIAPDLPRAALACSLAMRAQQHAARTMGLPSIEELSVTSGEHQHIVRMIGSRPGLFLLAMLDRKRANVALARFKLREAERALS